MSYITREMAENALKKMASFHKDLDELFQRHGMNLKENLGRRNILLSQAQEKYFAEELSSVYEGVESDGRTGQPDIVINSLGKELECKLTSKTKSGAYSFQSDYETLQKKGSLDYLYVVADENFEKFTVLHYEGLTTEDFRHLSPGARGKVSMKKHTANKKLNRVFGDLESKSLKQIKRLEDLLDKDDIPAYMRKKYNKSLQYWKTEPEKYTVVLEDIIV